MELESLSPTNEPALATNPIVDEPVPGPVFESAEPEPAGFSPVGPSPIDSESQPDEEPVDAPPLKLETPIKPKKKKKDDDDDDEKKPKDKKLVVAIIVAVLSLLIAVGVVLYFLVFRKTEPEMVFTDVETLVKVGAWEKQDAETVIWDFHEDGTGQLTTNKANYYDMKWEMVQDEEKQVLNITTSWLYELSDSFLFSFDRESNSFTVKNLADEKESVFMPLGTQAEKEMLEEKVEKTEEVEKPQE